MKNFLRNYIGVLVFINLFLISILFEESEIPQNNNEQRNGDQMAEKGECLNIWKPISTLICIILLYSGIVSLYSKNAYYIIPIYYIIGHLGFWCWHYYAHKSKGEIHDAHMEHHMKHFNKNDFYGDKSQRFQKKFGHIPHLYELMNPLNTITQDFGHDFSLIILLLLILIIGHTIFKTDYIIIGAVILMYAGDLIFESGIHASYHQRNFGLEKYSWFRELRAIHYLHHQKNANYSIINMLVDMFLNHFAV